MDRDGDQIRIKQLLTATIASLCSNSLSYSGELTIQGLLGITIDHKDILLVNINETLAHGEDGQTVVHTQAEYTQNATLQLTGTEQNYVSEDGIVAVRQKQAVNTSKPTASKNRVSEQISMSCIVTNNILKYFTFKNSMINYLIGVVYKSNYVLYCIRQTLAAAEINFMT